MKNSYSRGLMLTYIGRAIMSILCVFAYTCLIYCWLNDLLDWNQIETIRIPSRSYKYSFFVLLEVLALIALAKQKPSNRFLHIKEYVEIVMAILLIIADLYHATQSIVGLYAKTSILTLFFVANVSACFIYSRIRKTGQP